MPTPSQATVKASSYHKHRDRDKNVVTIEKEGKLSVELHTFDRSLIDRIREYENSTEEKHSKLRQLIQFLKNMFNI